MNTTGQMGVAVGYAHHYAKNTKPVRVFYERHIGELRNLLE